MATISNFALCLLVIVLGALSSTQAQLRPDFYDNICPQALPIIRTEVEGAISREPRLGASLLRLQFRDCFATGCDGSILLDDAPGIDGEKNARPNSNQSVREFEVIDAIKHAVDSACHGSVVSCADVLAVAARDSVAALGGPSYQVLLGRRDSRKADRNAALNDVPSPFMDFSQLLSNFQSHGMNLQDLVALSGAHTIGFAQCQFFRSRLYNESNIDPAYAAYLKQRCPPSGNNNRLAGLDGKSSLRFDTGYFKKLAANKGLLHSDQELFKGDGSASEGIVNHYIRNPGAFWADFGASMVKMGNISPLTGNNGEIRRNCRKIN